MAVDKLEVANTNDKALAQVSKKVHKLGPDVIIKASSEARSIFNHAIGSLICRNCGNNNPPSLLDVDNACCLNCGLNQEMTIYLGPMVPPVIEEPTNDQDNTAASTTVDLIEDGEQH
jgi:hypothetical protein